MKTSTGFDIEYTQQELKVYSTDADGLVISVTDWPTSPVVQRTKVLETIAQAFGCHVQHLEARLADLEIPC